MRTADIVTFWSEASSSTLVNCIVIQMTTCGTERKGVNSKVSRCLVCRAWYLEIAKTYPVWLDPSPSQPPTNRYAGCKPRIYPAAAALNSKRRRPFSMRLEIRLHFLILDPPPRCLLFVSRRRVPFFSFFVSTFLPSWTSYSWTYPGDLRDSSAPLRILPFCTSYLHVHLLLDSIFLELEVRAQKLLGRVITRQ